jgi:hypothetical protein
MSTRTHNSHTTPETQLPSSSLTQPANRNKRAASLPPWVALTAMFLSLLVSGSFTRATAQSTGLNGRVLDASGNAVPDVQVVATEIATGVTSMTRSTSAGVFDIFGLTPGAYTVEATKAGFAPARETGVSVTVSTVTKLDILLKVGSVEQSVSVTADASQLESNTASLATQISNKKFDDLALAQQGRIRSPVAFINLAPTVQGSYQLTGAENTSATNYIQVNGSQAQTTELYLDGVQAGRSRPLRQGSYNENAPSVDAIREFKVTTTLLPADYGHTGAAVGTFSMKSGTNRLHGSVYEYLRNNDFDAQPHGTTSPLFTHQNEFGATIGGPVVFPHLYNGRNRSFFFFSYGGSRKTGVDALQLLQIPTQAQIGGNFAGKNTIYDPATTRLDPTGKFFIRDPFPNNVIPANRIDAVAQKIAQYYPTPTPGLTGAKNYSTYSGEKLLNIDAEAARIDHQINDKNLVSGEFVFTYIPRIVVSTGLPSPLVGGQSQPARTNTGQAHWQWTPNVHALNQVALALNRYVSPSAPVSNAAIAPNLIGLPGISSSAPPSITFTNGYAATATNTLQYQVEDTYVLRDVFYLTAGAHQMRFGGELRRSQYNDYTPTPTSSSLAFSNLETANPTSQSSTGDAFASFLLGQVDSGALTLPLEIATRQNYAHFFAQDDWKVLPSLTFNLGLSYEFQSLPYEKANRSSIISLTTANSSAGNLPGATVFAGANARTFARSDYTGIGPRFGFAYQPLPSTVIRGGYGIYYSDTGLTIVTAGFQPQATYSSPNNGNTAAFVLASGFPTSSSLTPTLTPGLLNGQNGSFEANNADDLPRVQEWSLGIEQSFLKNWVLDLSYVGTHGTRLIDPQMSNVNQVDPKYLSLGSTLTQSVTSTAAIAAGITVPYTGFTGTVAQALRPYPQYKTLTSLAAKQGASAYNSLQVVLKKSISHGFTFDGNYTFSRNMGNFAPTSVLTGGVDNVLQNSFNPGAEWSVLPSDVRHALVLNYIYELPFGTGRAFMNKQRWERAVFGGFSVSAIQRYQSGFPLSILATNNLPIFNRVLRPNIVAGVDPATHLSANQFNPSVNSVINKAAFSQPAAFSFGNARPTYSGLSNFPIYDEDLAVVRRFPIGEAVQGTFYLQAFNAFNRHRFTSIDTNFNDATFGQPSGVSQARLVQLGLRLQY